MTPMAQKDINESLKPLFDSLETRYPDWSIVSGDNRFWYFCSYWPEELVLAMGWEPLRVFPRGSSSSPVLLPTYCCSMARSCMEMAEKAGKEMNYGEGFCGFAHSCDTVQCLGQLWNRASGMNTFFFVPPVALNAAGALEYTVEELKIMARSLEESTGISLQREDLKRAIELNNRVRKAVSKLDELRPYYPSQFITGLVRAAQVTPRALFAGTMEKAIPALEGQKEGSDRPGLVISGAVFENENLHYMIEELGARIVADDSCSGSRHFATPVGEQKDPFTALGERYMERPNCPCRYKTLGSRAEYLTKLATDRQAQGVILVLRKYCDPHAWDVVSLTERLRSGGIPVLLMELEGATPGGQERTRLQAFLESLQGGLSIE